MTCHYTSPRMAKIKQSYNIQILVRTWRKVTTQHCWQKCIIKWHSHSRKQSGSSIQKETCKYLIVQHLYFWALIKEKSKLIFTQKSVHKCLSSFHNIQKLGEKTPTHRRREWLNCGTSIPWNAHCRAIQRDKLLRHTTQMNLQRIKQDEKI